MFDYKTDKELMMSQWWQSPLGQSVFTLERGIIQSLGRHFHGYHQLQLGLEPLLLPHVHHPHQQTVMAPSADVLGCNETLPFKSHSIDTVLLGHVLEFSADPHQVLRDVERVLVADGTLILSSFNPWSLWGLRCLLSWQDQAPWQGHFFSHTRIKDWLKLLNFDIIETKKCLYQPPINNEKWFNSCAVLNRWGRRLWPLFSGVTILVASKRTIPLTPIAQRWQPSSLLPAGRLITKPASKLQKRDRI